MNIQEFRQQYPEYNDLSDKALADSLYQKSYSDMDRKEFDAKFLGAATQPSPPQPQPFDPMAESVANFQQGDDLRWLPTGKELAMGGLNALPVAGAIGGGLLGSPLGLPGMVAGAGVGAGTGESARQAISQYTGLEPPGTMRENIGNIAQQGVFGAASAALPGSAGVLKPALGGALTMGGAEAAKQSITGGYDPSHIGMSAAFGGAIGVGAPLIGKYWNMLFGEEIPIAKQAGDAFREFAGKNKLPFSIDAQSIKPSLALTQAAGDYGPGLILTNWQRGKLIDRTTQLSKTINEELGLVTPLGINTAADDLAAATKGLVTKSKTHANWNRSLKALPDDIRIDAQNLIDKVDEVGGLLKIDEIFVGQSGHMSRESEAIKRIIERGGSYDKADLEYLLNNLNRKYDLLTRNKEWELRKIPSLLKGAIVDDITYTQLPELNTTLGAVRSAADDAFSSARRLLNDYPILGRLLNPRSFKTPLVKSLFNEGNISAAQALREQLVRTQEGQNAWEALQSSYLKDVFESTLVKRGDFTRKVFDPGKYLDWYEKYGGAASKIFPEIAPALQEWEQIAQGISKDFQRRVAPADAIKTGFKALGVGGAGGYVAGGPVGMVAIPGFSTLAALGTMGPGNWGFIRNYLTKRKMQGISQNSRLLSIPPVIEAMEATK